MKVFDTIPTVKTWFLELKNIKEPLKKLIESEKIIIIPELMRNGIFILLHSQASKHPIWSDTLRYKSTS